MAGNSDDGKTAVLKAVSDQLGTLTERMTELQKQVNTLSKRPRPGGPSLDGQRRDR